MSMDAIESISDFPSIAYTEARSCSLKRKPFLYCDLTPRPRMNGCGRDELVIECARGKEHDLSNLCVVLYAIASCNWRNGPWRKKRRNYDAKLGHYSMSGI